MWWKREVYNTFAPFRYLSPAGGLIAPGACGIMLKAATVTAFCDTGRLLLTAKALDLHQESA